MRPRNGVRRLKVALRISGAICGKEQRRLTKQLMIFSLKKDQAVFAWFFCNSPLQLELDFFKK
ncbi:hypothetical protein AB685_00125 [Bacillus sp. LL01]|nr:hypothetical protein AB685_00125 [Bacillus sp. LL01]